MKRQPVLRAFAAILAITVLAVEVPPPAQAQVPLANAGIGLFRVINAINRRNRVYQAARDTQQDFNAYYNALQNTAREQLVAGELRSLRQAEGGLQAVRAGAYIRLTEGLRAEQAAISRAIDAETNQARREFNRTLVRQLQEIAIRLPGAQQILGEVRTVIANVRATVVALQAAAAANQPLDLLTQRLAEQVSSSAMAQQAVRNLGTLAGPDLDRALGGALTQVNNAIDDVTREANQAVELLDGMDAQVAQYDLSQAEAAGADERLGPLGIRLTDRANAALDVASQALAFLSAMQGTGGTTRDQMYQQIRSQLLQEHNEGLRHSAMSLQTVDCTGVGRGEYETAMGMLGKTPGIVPDPEHAAYMVCKQRGSDTVVYAYIVGGGIEALATPGEGTQAADTAIHVGTYVGEAEFPDLLKGNIVPEASYEISTPVNVVRVTVHEDGRVEGDLSYEAHETFTQRECSTRWDYSVAGTFGGSLTASAGTIPLVNTIEVTWTPILDDCGVPPGSAMGTYTWDMQIQVEGDSMTGAGVISDDSGQTSRVTFEARKE